MNFSQKFGSIWFWATFISLMVYYALIFYYTPGYGDTAKFQFLSEIWGTAHNPGYPLFVLLLHIWNDLIPFGTPAFKSNLLQPILMLGTLFLMWRIMEKMGISAKVCAITLLFVATTYIVLTNVTQIEAYNLLIFLGTLSIYLSMFKDKELLGWFAFSLAISHHPLGVVFLPFHIVNFKPNLKGILIRVAILLLAYSPYLLILFWTKWPYALYVESKARNIIELLDVIRGKQFSGNMDILNFNKNLANMQKIPKYLFLSVSILSVIFPFAVIRFWRRSEVKVFLYSTLLLLAVCTFYHIPDIKYYYLAYVPIIPPVASFIIDHYIKKRERLALYLFLFLIIVQGTVSFGKYWSEKIKLIRDDVVWRSNLYGLENAVVISKDDYRYRQRLLYYVLGEGLYIKKKVFAIYFVKFDEVKNHICYKKPLSTIPPAKTHQVLNVFTIDRDYEDRLKSFGCFLKGDKNGFIYKVSCKCESNFNPIKP